MNNEEFEAAYRKNFGFLIRYVMNYINVDYATAEDIVQDVFGHVYRNKEKLYVINGPAFRSYLETAVRSRAKDYMRRSSTKHETVSSDILDLYRNANDAISAEAKLLGMERDSYIRLIFEKLRIENEMNYDIFVKVKYMDVPPEEVAEEYGITRNNVNNRIHRTRLWLRENMQKLYGK